MVSVYLHEVASVDAHLTEDGAQVHGLLVLSSRKGDKVRAFFDPRQVDLLHNLQDAGAELADQLSVHDGDMRRKSPGATLARARLESDLGRKALVILRMVNECGPELLQFIQPEIDRVLADANRIEMVDLSLSLEDEEPVVWARVIERSVQDEAR